MWPLFIECHQTASSVANTADTIKVSSSISQTSQDVSIDSEITLCKDINPGLLANAKNCKMTIADKVYAMDAINFGQLNDKIALTKMLQSCSDNCFTIFAKILEYRVLKLDDFSSLVVWENMLRIRDQEFLCDHSLNMFIKNTRAVARALVFAPDTVLEFSIGLGLGYHFFERTMESSELYDDHFDGKILIWGIDGMPDEFYHHSLDSKENWFDVEKYLNGQINSGQYTTMEVVKLKQMLRSFEFARSESINASYTKRGKTEQDGIMIEAYGDIDNDGMTDRLVITHAKGERSTEYLTDPYGQPYRKLSIYRGTSEGYVLWIENNYAIPPYYCEIFASPETEIESVKFSNGVFSFVYTNKTYFSYEYIFKYQKPRASLFLDKIIIHFAYGQHRDTIAINKELTQKDFGERSLHKFNYYEGNALRYLPDLP